MDYVGESLQFAQIEFCREFPTQKNLAIYIYIYIYTIFTETF